MKRWKANLGTFLSSVLIFSLITPGAGVAGKTVLGPRIKVAASELNEINPQVSYNSVKKDFLIGWIDYNEKPDPNLESKFRTRARLLRPDGTMSAPRTYLTGLYFFNLGIQFDPEHDRYLMMWGGLDIKYRLLGPSGGVIKATHKGGFPDAVTYHPMNHEYLVASPLRRISFDGIPMNAVSHKSYSRPQLIPDSISANYFLFYAVSEPTCCASAIYYQILGSDGLAITSPRLVVRNGSDFSVAFDPLKRNFLLLYATESARWKVILINENGQRILNPVTLGIGNTWSSAIFNNNHFFVSYAQDSGAFFRELDSNAHPVGSAVALTNNFGEFDVEAADDGKFVIVWSEEDNDQIYPFTGYDVFARFFHVS